MINQKCNKERLEKYAKYLTRAKLQCKRFCSLGTRDKETKKKIETGELNSVVFLPIMELPIIFKGEWFYDEKHLPIYKEDPNQDTMSSIGVFFGINPCMFEHIFCPGLQSVEVYGGKALEANPPTDDIAENILKLLEAIKHYESIKGFSTAFNLN